MSSLSCIDNYIDEEKNFYGSFLIEPLDAGQGITLGNALRRTLLSDLTGFAITGVRINNVKHEFLPIEGIRDDILEILLNLKEIIFKTSFSAKSINNLKMKGFIHVTGPLIVTAGMFNLPKNCLKILNPTQYICTVVNDSEFYLEIDIESGKGYHLTEEKQKINLEEQFDLTKPSTLFIDSLFMPIKRVNYKIKLIHDSQGYIKESLFLEIITNGSITPKRSLQEGLKLLLNLFYPLFITPDFLHLSSKLEDKFLFKFKKNI